MSAVGVVAAVAAAVNAGYIQKNRENDDNLQIKYNLLLVNRKGITMVIGEKEKIDIYSILRINSSLEEKWTVKDGNRNRIFEESSFEKCVETLMLKINPKGIEIMPYSTNRWCVDGYYVFLKIDDKEAIEKEKLLMKAIDKVADDMTKNIETAW